MTGKNFMNTKFNCLDEGMIPILKVRYRSSETILKLAFLSHFLPKQLARCDLDPSFLLFLLLLESLSKLYLVPRNVTYRHSNLYALSHTHKPRRGNIPVQACLRVSKIPTTTICKFSVSSPLILL